MTFKLDSNISFMFKESQCLLHRYLKAFKAGFRGVECSDEIYQYSIEELVKAKTEANVEQVVIVAHGGVRNSVTAIPERESEFQSSLATSMDYAQKLGCKKVHICSGVVNCESSKHSAFEEAYIENLRYAALEAKKVGVTILIEPITTIPGYFLTDTRQAVDILKRLDCDNVKIEFDFFHAQRAHGNLTNILKENLPYIGHIQVSQVPGRGEPDIAGEINYSYIFQLLRDLGYNEWIGCEYNPQGKTEDGLKWIKEFGLQL